MYLNRVQCCFWRRLPFTTTTSTTSTTTTTLHQTADFHHVGCFFNKNDNLSVLDQRHINIGQLLRTLSAAPGLEAVRKMATAGAPLDDRKSNRLISEKSSYLLQHATNPVNWYPWGDEAFELAKKENKLIFLSVGYSTCHWCHVMEKESFENSEIADIMNKYYINIKVDREERPDVDKLYMTFIQATVGGGGWPMSVFLTPNLEPIAGGTYFPPNDSYGRPGFKTVLLRIAEQWRDSQVTIKNTGTQSMHILKLVNEDKLSDNIEIAGEECWKKAILQYSHSFDEDWGGFNRSPKFPQPTNFNFLFHMYARDGKNNSEQALQCLNMALTTLNKMAMGGIHDHVIGGFARYSVDDRWHVPHFEKMLYDQAQLAISYCDAFVLTKNDFYAEIVEDILTYVDRDLGHVEGGFYCAQDADSYPYEGAEHKREGAFCVWEYNELKDCLPEEDFQMFCHHYNVKEKGNVRPQQDPHGELKMKNVLACFGSYEDTANKFNLTVDELKAKLKKCHKILAEQREKRPKPHKDTKIVTSWNGLMIAGFARAGFVLKKQEYINRAIKAAKFLKKYLYNEHDKTLIRCCYGDGDSDSVAFNPNQINGFLDDYAFLIRGLLELYEASLDDQWLQWAEALQEQQDNLFWDAENFGYFTNAPDPNILIRSKEDQDGAEPCGNSVAVHNLIKLAAYLDRQDLRDKAGNSLSSFADRLRGVPVALPEMLSALLFYHDSPPQVFIAGKREDDNTQALLDVVRSKFIPGRILAVADGAGGNAGLLYARHESLSRLKPVGGKSAAYVCRNFTCSLPVTEPEELANFFESKNALITTNQPSASSPPPPAADN